MTRQKKFLKPENVTYTKKPCSDLQGFFINPVWMDFGHQSTRGKKFRERLAGATTYPVCLIQSDSLFAGKTVQKNRVRSNL